MKAFFIALLVMGFAFQSEAQGFLNPVNVGGKYALKQLHFRHLNYPQSALESKTKAKVTFYFNVDEKGNISDIRHKSSVDSKEMEKEAERLFNLLLFEPATDNGEPVPFGHKVTITFSPSAYKSDVKKRGYEIAPYSENLDREEVYEQVEIQAQVGEHRYELAEFIKDNLKYPKEAFERNISGQVMVRLVVEKSGLPSNMKVIQSIGGGCDEEALRIISKLSWNPAKVKGNSVRSWIEIPIVFNL